MPGAGALRRPARRRLAARARRRAASTPARSRRSPSLVSPEPVLTPRGRRARPRRRRPHRRHAARRPAARRSRRGTPGSRPSRRRAGAAAPPTRPEPGDAGSATRPGPAFLTALARGPRRRARSGRRCPGRPGRPRWRPPCRPALAGGRGARRRRARRARPRPGRRRAGRGGRRRASRCRPTSARPSATGAGCASCAARCAAVVGTRAAAFAPVADLGLVVVWDDGDDLHAEPRAPYPHVREVLALRAHLTGAAVLRRRPRPHRRGAAAGRDRLGPAARGRPRRTVRAAAPARRRHVRRPARPRPARPGRPAARRRPSTPPARALAAGAPVLVQVPAPRLRRRAWPAPATARPPAAPPAPGPLGRRVGTAVAACRWCGRLAGDWRCPDVRRARGCAPSVVGARRTAEELGRAFPGAPVRTSGRDGVLATVPAEPALVVSTPGRRAGRRRRLRRRAAARRLGRCSAAPTCGRGRRRCGAGSPRRRSPGRRRRRPGRRGRRPRRCPPVQALVRWDPAGRRGARAGRARGARLPAGRRAWPASSGPPAAVAERAWPTLPAAAGGRRARPGAGRRRRGAAAAAACPRARGAELAAALKAAAGGPQRPQGASRSASSSTRAARSPSALAYDGHVATRPIRLFGDPVLRTPPAGSRPSTRSCAPSSRTSPTPCSRRPASASPRRRSASACGCSSTTSTTSLGHLVNPVLHFPSDEEQDGPEGCLSLPDLTFDCVRKQHVVAHGQNVYGDPVTRRGQRPAGPLRPARDRPPRRRAVHRPARPRDQEGRHGGRSARPSGPTSRAPVVKASPHPLFGRAR